MPFCVYVSLPPVLQQGQLCSLLVVSRAGILYFWTALLSLFKGAKVGTWKSYKLGEDFNTKRSDIWGFLVLLWGSFQSKAMFPAAMSNSTSLSEEASVSSGTRVQDFGGLNPMVSTISPPQTQKIKKKRSLPGNPGKIMFWVNLFKILSDLSCLCFYVLLNNKKIFVYAYMMVFQTQMLKWLHYPQRPY